MINKETIISSYDDKLTLLKWLKTVEAALNNSVLDSVSVSYPTAATMVFTFHFEDNTTISTPAINIPAGPQGEAATVNVGTVTTLNAGQNATVTNSGTSDAAVLNFGIPKGADGAPGGITNINGYTGPVTTGDGLAFSNGALSSYDFNLTDTASKTASELSTTTELTAVGGNIHKAVNTDGTIGKIYGRLTLRANSTTAGTYWIPTGWTVDAPTSAYTIATGGIGLNITNNIFRDTFVRVDTYGNVFIGLYLVANDTNDYACYYPACLYFFKDFGDTPNRELTRSMSNMSSERILNIDELERA